MTHAFKGVRRVVAADFQGQRFVGREAARRLDDQRHPERAFGLPWTPVYKNIGCGVVYAESGANGGGWQCDLRPAAYLGGAGGDYGIDAFRQPGGSFPNGGSAYFVEPVAYAGAVVCRCGGGPRARRAHPQAPGVARNSFRGPRYLNVDATLNKAVRAAGGREASERAED